MVIVVIVVVVIVVVVVVVIIVVMLIVIVLGTWVSLSMSGTGTGTSCGCGMGRIGSNGMQQRHADFTNACLLLFFLRLQSQIKLELKQYYGQQQLGQT